MVYTVNEIQFTRRKKIKLSHSGALTDYQLKLTITYETAMQADFDDIRFSTLAGVNIPYWVESKTNSVTADIWIKYDQVDGDTHIYIHYGNSGLSSAESITDVMIFGDDFDDDSLDTSKWTATGSNVTESGGTLQIIGTDSWNANGITSDVTFDRSSKGYIMTFRVKTSVASGYKMFGYAPQPLDEANGLYNYLDDGGGGIGRWRARYDGASGTPFINSISADTWYYAELLLKQTQGYTFFVDGTQYDDDNTFADNNHRVSINQYSSGQTLSFDYIFLREYTATEPTDSIGTEQHQRRIPRFI